MNHYIHKIIKINLGILNLLVFATIICCMPLYAYAKDENVDSKSEAKSTDSDERIIILNEKQLQNLIDELPESDKKTIADVQKQINSWPKELFDEISDYREFVISSKKLAQEKYNRLSPEAKSAIETEQTIKKQLSLPTIKKLQNVEIRQ